MTIAYGRSKHCSAVSLFDSRAGDPVLVESVRSAAGDNVTHILDWFHISMGDRHVEQALAGLLGSGLEHKGPPRSG